MKKIQRNEIYRNLTGFLAGKGVELKDGSYAETLAKGCQMLTDVINLSQQGIDQARQGIDQKLDKLRRIVHDKTAPKPPAKPAPAKAKTSTKAKAAPKAQPARKAAKVRPTATRKGTKPAK